MTRPRVPVEIKNVPFGAYEIESGFDENIGCWFVNPHHMCEQMGLDWRSQRRKIIEDPQLSKYKGEVRLTSPGGTQTFTILYRKGLPRWLMSINVNQIPDPEVRERVIEFQDECDDALDKYWNEGAAFNPRFPLEAHVLQEVQTAMSKWYNGRNWKKGGKGVVIHNNIKIMKDHTGGLTPKQVRAMAKARGVNSVVYGSGVKSLHEVDKPMSASLSVHKHFEGIGFGYDDALEASTSALGMYTRIYKVLGPEEGTELIEGFFPQGKPKKKKKRKK